MSKKYKIPIYIAIIILIVLGSYLVIRTQSLRIALEVEIDGLENGDSVELMLVSSLSMINVDNAEDKEILFLSRKLGNGSHRLNIPPLPNDSYILFVKKNEDYLRDPKGFLIGIENDQIVYRDDKEIHFQLIPLSSTNLSATNLLALSEPIADILSPPKQPEPSRPLIAGEMTGVLDETIITFHVRLLGGSEVLWGTRKGNGEWEAVISNVQDGEDYVISVEADGYISESVSYKIHVSELTAYLIEDDQITNQEANHLDFHFISVSSPISEPNPLYGTRWKLVTIESEEITLNIPEENEFFVRFHSDSFNFTGGCNSIGGDYVLENNRITVTFAHRTEMDCSHLGPNVTEIEMLFSDAMPTFISYELNGEELRIQYIGGEIFLKRASY